MTPRTYITATFLTLTGVLTHLRGIAQPTPYIKPVRVYDTSAWSYGVRLGYNFGATAPLSLPDNIRHINSWSPSFSPLIGAEIRYKLNRKWSLSAGLNWEMKSMTVKDEVLYIHTIITAEDGQNFEGIFSGKNTTRVRNMYLTLPVAASYHLSPKWLLEAGLYAGLLIDPYFKGDVSDGHIHKGSATGEKVTIDHANFDFSSNERKFDWGLQIGAERTIHNNWSASAQFNWGVQPVFPSSFTGVEYKMYNLFLNLGVKYNLERIR
ncbi:porin family protein [Chitinophagaceae bacterium MMS25-I14]